MLSVRCLSLGLSPVLSCLSVTLVYCDQTAGRIEMPLGMEIGLDPGDFVLDGTQLPHGKGHSSPTFEIYGHRLCLRPYNPWPICLLWPNGRLSQLLLSTCNLAAGKGL